MCKQVFERYNHSISLFKIYFLCNFEKVQHFGDIVSYFSLTLQRDAFAGACDFVALVKQLSCERYLICFAFREF